MNVHTYPLLLSEAEHVHVVFAHDLESGHIGPAIGRQAIDLLQQRPIANEILQRIRRHSAAQTSLLSEHTTDPPPSSKHKQSLLRASKLGLPHLQQNLRPVIFVELHK